MNGFAFIAFNHETGLPLAHGRTAAHAAATADQLAPDATLYVLDAHHVGPWIWAERVALVDALEWDAMRRIMSLEPARRAFVQSAFAVRFSLVFTGSFHSVTPPRQAERRAPGTRFALKSANVARQTAPFSVTVQYRPPIREASLDS